MRGSQRGDKALSIAIARTVDFIDSVIVDAAEPEDLGFAAARGQRMTAFDPKQRTFGPTSFQPPYLAKSYWIENPSLGSLILSLATILPVLFVRRCLGEASASREFAGS